jgi:hypothetical protein
VDLFQLFYQIGPVVHPAGGIRQDDPVTAGPGTGHRIVNDRAGIGAGTLAYQPHPEPFRVGGDLFHRRGAERVPRGKHHSRLGPPLAEVVGQFGKVGRLPDAVHTKDQHHVQQLRIQGKVGAVHLREDHLLQGRHQILARPEASAPPQAIGEFHRELTAKISLDQDILEVFKERVGVGSAGKEVSESLAKVLFFHTSLADRFPFTGCGIPVRSAHIEPVAISYWQTDLRSRRCSRSTRKIRCLPPAGDAAVPQR